MKTSLLLTVATIVVSVSLVALTTGCSRSYAHRVVSIGDDQLTVSEEGGYEQQTHQVAPDAKITLDGQPVQLQQLDPGDEVMVTVQSVEGRDVATEITAKSVGPDEGEQRPEPEQPPIQSDEPQPVPPLDDPTSPPSETTPEQEGAPAAIPDANRPESGAAIDPEEGAPRPAEEIFEGKISSIQTDAKQFAVRASDDDENERTFHIDDGTKVTLDGQQATFADLQVGHLVKVTAEADEDQFMARSVEARAERTTTSPDA
jgi:hypothetical protein